MKRFVPALTTAVVVLAAGSGAHAKVPPEIELCGANACVRLSVDQSMLILDGSGEYGRPLRKPSAFYVLRWKWEPGGEEHRAYYVPAARAFRWPSGSGTVSTWVRVREGTAGMLESAAKGLSPFPVAPPSAVMVGTREARGPETYFRLLEGRPAGFTPVTSWVTVRMHSDPAGPWTDAASEIRISARGRTRLVYMDGWVHRVPLAVANRARRGLPLTP
jgi:hypothetical protein